MSENEKILLGQTIPLYCPKRKANKVRFEIVLHILGNLPVHWPKRLLVLTQPEVLWLTQG